MNGSESQMYTMNAKGISRKGALKIRSLSAADWNNSIKFQNPKATVLCIKSIYHLKEFIWRNSTEVFSALGLEKQPERSFLTWKRVNNRHLPNIQTLRTFFTLFFFLFFETCRSHVKLPPPKLLLVYQNLAYPTRCTIPSRTTRPTDS